MPMFVSVLDTPYVDDLTATDARPAHWWYADIPYRGPEGDLGALDPYAGLPSRLTQDIPDDHDALGATQELPVVIT